jgi:hypothetical protein
MKMTLRQAARVSALVVTMTVFSAPNFAQAFQSARGMANGRGHYKVKNKNRDYRTGDWNNNNSSYQRGLNDGREDGARNRNRQYRWQTNNDSDRRAYEAGYEQGYRDSARYDNNDDRRYRNNDGLYSRNDQYGRSGSTAAQFGYQDGLKDGRQDRATGHSNRPTQGDNYKNATRGFPGGAGQTAYKAEYRQAYVSGYQRGYGEQMDGRYDRNGQYPINGNTAAQFGSQDGFNDGRQDRLTGHSNRPTQGDNYKDATRGFPGGPGETAYKATYRQAYVTAYQQGYSQQSSARRY